VRRTLHEHRKGALSIGEYILLSFAPFFSLMSNKYFHASKRRKTHPAGCEPAPLLIEGTELKKSPGNGGLRRHHKKKSFMSVL
jgi:hypothetical protein